jgi:hypothetical protein
MHAVPEGRVQPSRDPCLALVTFEGLVRGWPLSTSGLRGAQPAAGGRCETVWRGLSDARSPCSAPNGTLSSRLPESLHRNAPVYAEQEGVFVDPLTATALAEKPDALGLQDHSASRAARASKEKFQRALAQVPEADVDAIEGAA